MRLGFAILSASIVLFQGQVARAQELFDVPLRIAMGGTATEDSFGRMWLGEGPGPGDPLNIRPDDRGGANWVENWLVGNFQPDALAALGFNPDHPGDNYIFNTIRWDTGNDGIDFRIEIPIPNGNYLVNMYFTEGCCTNRHFMISIQDEIVDDDVSYLDYDPVAPALGRTGVLHFQSIEVNDRLLKIGLLPCPACPGGGDINAIINGLEVLSGEGCDHLGLDFNCFYNPTGNEVVGTWNLLGGAEGFRVKKDGEIIADLGAGAASFTDPTPRSGGAMPSYLLEALDGGVVVNQCRASVKAYVSPGGLTCDVTPGVNEVTFTWSAAGADLVTGYEVRRDGALLATLPASAASYEDNPTTRTVQYSIQALSNPPGLFSPMRCEVAIESNPFAIPLRINMGGAETVDSHGNVWLGDGPGAGDILAIRPDDASGTNFIENWSVNVFQPDSLENLGFDPNHPGDRYIFNTIRWDVGNDGIDFRISLAVPNDEYFVNLFFNEGCCTNRHFKIELQGEIVDDDVSYLDYDTARPALGRVGRLTFPADVTAQVLDIGLLPCPECPGATDTNAIINAVEVIRRVCIPGFRQCPTNLKCVVEAGGEVTGSWDAPLCLDPIGYEVRRDGALIQTLPAGSLGFTDTLTRRVSYYQVTPLLAAGADPCLNLACTAVTEELAFEAPVRLNMGGATTVDSRGRTWLGDGPGPGDPLALRPDDTSGTNFIENWCVNASINQDDSMISLGFNPRNIQDQYIMNSIRWDVGADLSDFRLEIPIKNGFYQVNLYFTECCCTNRHFQVELQGEVIDDDVSYLDYDPHKPALGRTGRLSFDGTEVADGLLRIGFLPCLVCTDPSGIVDTNAIVDAIEILPADTPLVSCPRSLVTVQDGGQVTGTWVPGENVSLTGYDVYREGTKIASLPANASQFVDAAPLCQRYATYELAPLSDDPSFLCPGMRIKDRLINLDCPFATPLRINMGGVEMVDSHGNTWLGDGPGVGDPLQIRVDDLSGVNTIENWSIGVFQADSLAALGFDPDHPGDRYIFNTIRWDTGNDGIDFRMELPVESGVYTVNLYFNEGCCTNRHFKIEIQEEIVDDDVSYLDYDPVTPALGRVGRLAFEETVVEDGILRIALLPCPECPGGGDINAIVNAIEVLLTDTGPAPPSGLRATAGDRKVDLSWNAVAPPLAGYNVYRSLTAGGPYIKQNAAPLAQTAYADVDLQNGLLYCYVVRTALDDGSESRNSNEACATPQSVSATFRRGDSDANGAIELTDAIKLLNYLFLGQTKPECLDAADTDDSGEADISDAISNLNYQFLGAAAPALPGPFNCGPDPTADVPVELGCDKSCP